jgi:hypothetical protein
MFSSFPRNNAAPGLPDNLSPAALSNCFKCAFPHNTPTLEQQTVVSGNSRRFGLIIYPPERAGCWQSKIRGALMSLTQGENAAGGYGEATRASISPVYGYLPHLRHLAVFV